MLKIISSTILIALLMTMSSCGGDGVDCDNEQELENFVTEVTQKYITAFTTFSTDPTQENCEAVRKATEEYIDDLEPLRECVPSADRAEYDRELNEARAELSAISCG